MPLLGWHVLCEMLAMTKKGTSKQVLPPASTARMFNIFECLDASVSLCFESAKDAHGFESTVQRPETTPEYDAVPRAYPAPLEADDASAG